MNILRTAALTAVAASALAGTTLAGTPQASAATVPTDRCYQFTVDEYTNYIPLVPWTTNVEQAAKKAGVSLVWGHSTGLACAPSALTVRTMLSTQHVHDVTYTPAHSVADGVYARTYFVNPNIVFFDNPHREPIERAQKAGLELTFTKSGNYETMTVTGNPAVIFETFGTDFRQVG